MSNWQEIFGPNGFDVDSVEPMKDHSVVPPGKYVVQIERAEMKPNRAATGHFVELVLVILEGEHQKRKMWDRINVSNPSEKCTQMGRAVMSAIGRSLGVSHLQDVSQLLNGILVAHVKVKGEQNEVRTYSSLAKYREEQAKQSVAGEQQTPAVVASYQQQQQQQQVAAPVQPQQQPQQQAQPVQNQATMVQPQVQPPTQPWARPQ
jgi:hypothetical protein